MFKNKNGKHTHKINNYLYSKNNRDDNGKNHRNFFEENKNDIIRINKLNPRITLDAILLEHKNFYINPEHAPHKTFVGRLL